MKHDGEEVVESLVASGLVVGLPIEAERLFEFARQPSKFTRQDFDPGHFTASAVIANDRGDSVFLIEHPKLGRWLQPGGHIEASDRSIAAAAVREGAEETGFALEEAQAQPVALSVHRIPAWKGEPSHLHLDLQFLFRLGKDAGRGRGEAELGGRWFALDAPETLGALEHTRRRVRDLLRGPGPFGDPSRHLSAEELEPLFEALAPPRDTGVLALVVSRRPGGERRTLQTARLTPESGVPGDAWARRTPLDPEAQVTLMRVDIARLLANGQPLTLFGDNLLVDLDLSVANLPPGARLRIGSVLLEVTSKPHNGCAKFQQRFGRDALRLTAARRHRQLRPRGLYARVLEAGEVEPGDSVKVCERLPAADQLST